MLQVAVLHVVCCMLHAAGCMLHVAEEAMGEFELSVQGPDEIVIAREEIGLREASRRFLEVARCIVCTLHSLHVARCIVCTLRVA